MNIKSFVGSIYDFQGTPDEWLKFEKGIFEKIRGFSDEERDYLTESDAMEYLNENFIIKKTENLVEGVTDIIT